MKKLILSAILILLLSTSALAKFSTLDKIYCSYIDSQHYCIKFVQNPVFGPGWQGDAYLVHDLGTYPLGPASSRDGLNINFPYIDAEAKIQYDVLTFYEYNELFKFNAN